MTMGLFTEKLFSVNLLALMCFVLVVTSFSNALKMKYEDILN